MTLPPLRDRKDDVRVLADFFVSRYSIQYRGTIFRLPDEVRTMLRRYDWPGNVSELKGSIKQSLAPGVSDWPENLLTWCNTQMRTKTHPTGIPTGDVKYDVRRFLQNNPDLPLKIAKQRYAMQVESRIMKAVLSSTRGNCKKAAGLLSISYKSMLSKAKAYQLV
jgi:transcriptional regulator with PAS, ATPase and Fis domain